MNEHQTVLLSMLKDLDRVCRQNNISYMLFAGTALGAVRHRGFIPWDDDLDVIMLRNEYERFLSVAPHCFDRKQYFVQKEFSEHWPMQFSKLRLNGTACLEKYHPKDPAVHQGVYIDIFPCDNLSNRGLIRGAQFVASKIIIAKSLYRRGYETNNTGKKVFMQFCRILPLRPFYKICVRKKDGNTTKVHSFLGGASRYRNSVFQREWMENTSEVLFEDSVFPISNHYDELLTVLYGDYHQLPQPEEIKKKEHVAVLDLQHSYEEYLEEQETMCFDHLTRSIR